MYICREATACQQSCRMKTSLRTTPSAPLSCRDTPLVCWKLSPWMREGTQTRHAGSKRGCFGQMQTIAKAMMSHATSGFKSSTSRTASGEERTASGEEREYTMLCPSWIPLPRSRLTSVREPANQSSQCLPISLTAATRVSVRLRMSSTVWDPRESTACCPHHARKPNRQGASQMSGRSLQDATHIGLCWKNPKVDFASISNGASVAKVMTVDSCTGTPLHRCCMDQRVSNRHSQHIRDVTTVM